MVTVGNSTDCTKNSGCLAKDGNESGNNQSSPDSLGTYPTWIVTQVVSTSATGILKTTSLDHGQDGNLLMPKVNLLVSLQAAVPSETF